ncbi:ribonuclease P protein component [Caldibacillus lycopersici]|uniref:Ribonuclease P protein component n=1 Tax=Perspicuibacillus lycopersici TaxID=1325689 RepID=A0AAE3IWS3_9BACI|nr:ribonuclease P protein component [Perspicuibacillus lycopersici]MCU9613485.1 ribonuclease P protein component [Perspicuibacillus lycopersici]
MKKSYRVKKNEEFQAVFKKGQSVANRQFIIYKLLNSDQEHFRIGLSVSKKIGNAVTRNQVKRYIKQAFHELEKEISPLYDYIIIARKPAADMSFAEVKKSLQHVLKLAKVLKRQ